jgi:hypothetical protein
VRGPTALGRSGPPVQCPTPRPVPRVIVKTLRAQFEGLVPLLNFTTVIPFFLHQCVLGVLRSPH